MSYGFIYIWYDRKHKRYYVGAHWGTEDDGYVCSSPWMNQAYNKRPHDFRRRVLSIVNTNRKDMFDEEARWQSMIKDEELRVRYYNVKRHGDRHWSSDPNRHLSVREKLSAAATKNHENSEWRKKYEAGLQKRDNKSSDPDVREKRRQSMLGKNVGRPKTAKFYESRERLRGRKLTEEHKQRVADAGTFKKLNSTKVSCVHCRAEGNPGNIARYHNDRCKNKGS